MATLGKTTTTNKNNSLLLHLCWCSSHKKENNLLFLLHHLAACNFLNRSFVFMVWLGTGCLWVPITSAHARVLQHSLEFSPSGETGCDRRAATCEGVRSSVFSCSCCCLFVCFYIFMKKWKIRTSESFVICLHKVKSMNYGSYYLYTDSWPCTSRGSLKAEISYLLVTGSLALILQFEHKLKLFIFLK